MKKFQKFVAKGRLLLNLWSVRQQIRLTVALIDRIKKDIAGAQDVLRLVEEYVPESGVAKKLAALEADRQSKLRELEHLRLQADEIITELAA